MTITITSNRIVTFKLGEYEHKMSGFFRGNSSKEFVVKEGHDSYEVLYKDESEGRGIISPRTLSNLILKAEVEGVTEEEAKIVRESVRKSYLPVHDRIWGRHASHPLKENRDNLVIG